MTTRVRNCTLLATALLAMSVPYSGDADAQHEPAASAPAAASDQATVPVSDPRFDEKPANPASVPLAPEPAAALAPSAPAAQGADAGSAAPAGAAQGQTAGAAAYSARPKTVNEVRQVKFRVAVLSEAQYEIILRGGAVEDLARLLQKNPNQDESFFDDLVCALQETRKVNVMERAKINDILRERSLWNRGVTASDIKSVERPIRDIHYYLTATFTKESDGLSNALYVVRTRLISTRGGEVAGSARAENANRYSAIQKAVRTLVAGIGVDDWYMRVVKVVAYDAQADVLRGRPEEGIVVDAEQTRSGDDLIEKLSGERQRGTVTKVYLSAGANDGVKPGTKFYVLRSQGDLIDPELGSALGTAEVKIGLVEVTEVKPDYSIATILKCSRPLQRCDRVIQFTGVFVPPEVMEQ